MFLLVGLFFCIQRLGISTDSFSLLSFGVCTWLTENTQKLLTCLGAVVLRSSFCHGTCSSHWSCFLLLHAVPPPDALSENSFHLGRKRLHHATAAFRALAGKRELFSCPPAQSSYRSSQTFSLNLPVFLFSRNSARSE